MAVFIVGVVLVVANAARRWVAVWRGAPPPAEAFGRSSQTIVRCC